MIFYKKSTIYEISLLKYTQTLHLGMCVVRVSLLPAISLSLSLSLAFFFCQPEDNIIRHYGLSILKMPAFRRRKKISGKIVTWGRKEMLMKDKRKQRVVRSNGGIILGSWNNLWFFFPFKANHTHTHTQTHTHSLSLFLSLSFTHTLTLSLSLTHMHSLSYTHTQYTHTIHTHSLSLSLSLTHTHTHTQTHTHIYESF